MIKTTADREGRLTISFGTIGIRATHRKMAEPLRRGSHRSYLLRFAIQETGEYRFHEGLPFDAEEAFRDAGLVGHVIMRNANWGYAMSRWRRRHGPWSLIRRRASRPRCAPTWLIGRRFGRASNVAHANLRRPAYGERGSGVKDPRSINVWLYRNAGPASGYRTLHLRT